MFNYFQKVPGLFQRSNLWLSSIPTSMPPDDWLSGCRVLMHRLLIDSKVKRLTGSQSDSTLLRLLLLSPPATARV